MKSILITGCSSGIGYDAAHHLAKNGWQVFATCRLEKDCKRLRSEGLESFCLDYRDEASIKAAVKECIKRTGGTLDALFNNGAFGFAGFVADYPRDALRDIFEVNLFGQFDLINQIIPIMLKQGHGRIINCSSVLGLVALRGRGAYNSTKFAMEGLTDTMRMEMKNTPIHFSLIEPGPITTMIREKSRPHFEKWIDWENSPRRSLYEKSIMPRLYDDTPGKDFGELPASAVTKKLVRALTSKRPKARYYVTLITYFAGYMRRILPTRALDAIFSRV